MAETRETVYVCGDSGTLTPAAQLELEQFGWHLKYHLPRNLGVEGCRFCAERQTCAALTPDRAEPRRT